MSLIKVILFKLDEFTEIISATQNFKENKQLKFYISSVHDDVLTVTKNTENTVFAFAIETKDDFQFVIDILKKNVQEIKDGIFKAVFVQSKKNIKIETLLRKFGCSDFLDNSISEKSFTFKIDFWTKGVFKNIQELEQKKRLKNSQDPVSSHYDLENIVEEKPLKDDKYDIWVSPPKNCKKVLSNWLVSFYGPSPHVSSWLSVGDDVWKFVIEEKSKHRFYKNEGHWYFKGLKPEFSWKETVWKFSSSLFHLYFIDSSLKQVDKVISQEEKIIICKNSMYGNLLKKEILKSAESAIGIEKNKTEKEESKEEFSNSQHIDTKIKGDIDSPEEKIGGKYSGSIKSETKSSTHYGFKGSGLQEASRTLELAFDDTKQSAELSLDNVTKNSKVMARISVVDSNETYLCQFEDLFEKELSLNYRKGSLPEDKVFNISVSLSYGTQKVSITTIGKIISKEDSIYTFEIEDIGSSEMERFMKLFEERQDSVYEFMKMARGF